MNKVYSKIKRKLAVLLSAAMILTSISVPVYAEELESLSDYYIVLTGDGLENREDEYPTFLEDGQEHLVNVQVLKIDDDTELDEAYYEISGTTSANECGTYTVYVEGKASEGYLGKINAKWSIVGHSHAFALSAYGDTLTAECAAEEGSEHCEYNDGDNINLTFSAQDMTYSGNPYSASNLSVSLSNEKFYELTGIEEPNFDAVEFYKGADKLDEAPVNAGSYTAKLTVAGEILSADFSINKALAKNYAPTKKDSAYINSYVDLAKPKTNVPEGVTVKYSTDNETWSEEVPRAEEPGTYSVYYRITGDENYEDYIPAVPLSSTIKKADINNATITFSQKKVAKDGDNLVSPDITVNYKGKILAEGTDYDITSGVSGNAVGDYTLVIAACEDSTYFTGSKSATWSIVELDTSWTREFTYDGDGHDIVVTYNGAESYTVRYRRTGSGLPYSISKVSIKDVCEGRVYVDYLVTYTDSDGTQNLSGKAYAEVVPAAVELEAASVDYTYDGNAKVAPDLSAKAGSLKDRDTISITAEGVGSELTETSAGSYTEKATAITVISGSALSNAEAAMNYTFDLTKTFNWEIKKADLQLSPACTVIPETDYDFDHQETGLAKGEYTLITASANAVSKSGDLIELKEEGIHVEYALYKTDDTEVVAWTSDYEDIKTSVAGEYKVACKVVGDDNHNDLAVSYQYVKLNPAPLAIATDAAAAGGLVYTGGELGLLSTLATVNDPSKGHPEYAVTETETEPIKGWSEDEPKATNAGTYYVWYKAAAINPSSKDSDAAHIAVTVAPKNLVDGSVALDSAEFVYDGSEKTAVVKLTGTDAYLTKDDLSISGDKQTNASVSYNVVVTGQNNYTGSKTLPWRITKASRTVTVESYTAEYDGAAHGVSVSVNDAEACDILYSDAVDGEYSTTPIEVTGANAASPKTVWVKVIDKSGNYENTDPQRAVITINKKAVTLSASPLQFTYIEGTWQGPEITAAGCIDGESIVVTADVDAEMENADTYTAQVTGDACLSGAKAANYTVNGPKTFDYEIKKADYVPEESKKPVVVSGLIYTGGQQALIEADSIDPVLDGISTYAIADTKPAEISGSAGDIKGTNAGSYTIWWKIAPANTNYNEYCVSMNAVIEQAQLQYAVVPVATTPTYSGTDRALAVAGSVSVNFVSSTDSAITEPKGKVLYRLSTDTEYSEEIPTAKEKGTYTVYYKIESTNSNCLGVAPASFDTTIGKQSKDDETVYTYLTRKVSENNVVVKIPSIEADQYMVYSDPEYAADVPFTVSLDKENSELLIKTNGDNITEQDYNIVISVVDDATDDREANYNDYTITVVVKGGICNHRAILTHSKIEPTCTESGMERYYECKYCGETFTNLITKTFVDISTLEIEPNGHESDNELNEELAPTCVSDGFKCKHCTVCGDAIEGTEETIDKLDHNYDEAFEVKAATCSENGVMAKVCMDCGTEVFEDITERREHSFGAFVEDKPATCTTEGAEFKTCSVCGEKENRCIAALGHSFADDYTVDVSANCVKNGIQSKHCTNPGCDERTDIELLPKTAHAFGPFITDKPQTCTTEGVTVRTCADCGIKEFDYLGTIGHHFANEYTVDVSANCVKEGWKSKHCIRPGCLETADGEVIPREEHPYGAWTVERVVTCTTDGVQTRVCEYCKHKEFKYIDHAGHSFAADYTVDVSANCVSEGIQSKHCINPGCSEREDIKLLPKTEHAFGEFVVEKPQTCTTDGVAVKTCAECGIKEFEYRDRLGHDFDTEYTVDVSANCILKGSKSRHCKHTGCNERVDVQVIPRTEHALVSENTVLRTPTCTEKGYMIRECMDCDYHKITEVAALGHAYAAEPVFVWNDELTSCVGEFICANDVRHVIAIDAKIDVKDLGVAVYYTASFEYKGKRYFETKTVVNDDVNPEEILTLEEATEIIEDYGKAADIIGGKMSGMISTIQAPGTVGSVSANYADGKFLALVVHPTQKGEASITVNAKTKIQLPGSDSYEMTVYDGGEEVAKPKSYATLKADKNTGLYTLTTKANRKAVNGEYTVVLTNDSYDITVKVENIKAGSDYGTKVFNTNVQGVDGDSPEAIRAALDSDAAVTVELSKTNTAPAKKSAMLSAVWMIEKTTLKNGEEGYGVFTKGRLTVYYRVNVLQGTITLIPAKGARGSINLTGVVNGIKYKNTLRAKPM